ncbi:MAG TPA: hypothetical protein PL033_06995 [Candidatus Brocadiia bacterium]|nr:hypothetical protein [Candidatus Brocadiia bacterium]
MSQAHKAPSPSQSKDSGKSEDAFSSNSVRLSGRQWFAALVVFAAFCVLVPAAWSRAEHFAPGRDYRVPYSMSDDYWHYARLCRRAREREDVVLIGDSVVWGEYVSPDKTLSAHLNALDGKRTYANLGVDGTHPAAMLGLVRYYGRAISGRRVLLHFNPLWMTSPRVDLQTEKEFRFNHSKLVPQFFPRIPCFKDPYPNRIGTAIGRYMPVRAWVNHVSLVYLDNSDPASWTINNPLTSPIGMLTMNLPEPETAPRHEQISWTERGMKPSNFEWVSPEMSLQLMFFKQTAELLLSRGNRVLVILGPFNEHAIAAESKAGYGRIIEGMRQWLDKKGIPSFAPPLLPSEQYGDSSHPLYEGYSIMAKGLLESEAFRREFQQ